MATSGKTKKSTKSKTGAKPRTKTIAADAGPVTLAEAKALAQAKQPKLAVRAARKSAAPPASPAAVGVERKNLEKERREYSRIQGHDGDHEEGVRGGHGREKQPSLRAKNGL